VNTSTDEFGYIYGPHSLAMQLLSYWPTKAANCRHRHGIGIRSRRRRGICWPCNCIVFTCALL